MPIADFLKTIGNDVATGAKVAGAVAQPVLQRTAQVISGEAPAIDAQQRADQEKARDAKAQDLASQLEMGRKYGTLTPDQQQQYVDAIHQTYSDPSMMGTLVQKVHSLIHPDGTSYQAAAPDLTNATPEGGTSQADYANALGLAEARAIKKEYVSPDGKERDWFRPGEQPPSWNAVMSGSGMNVRQGSHIVIPSTAVQLMNNVGAQFNKQDGTAWTEDELNSFPEGTALQQFVRGDQTYFSPVNQRVLTKTFGNVVSQVPEAGMVTPQNTNALGLARVPTTTTHQVPGMNPGEVLTMTGTSTPATTGAVPVTPAAPHTGAGQVNPAAPPTVSSGAATSPPRTKVGSIIKPSASGPKSASDTTALGASPSAFAPGTMLVQGRTAMPVVSAMSVVGANVFGVNGEPPIWDYAKMYDDPKMASALNKALTMNSLTLPGVHGEPGFWDSLATAAGVTGWSQEKINKAAVDARKDVQQLGGDKGMKFLSRLMAFQEDLSALRTATKASAAQGSIQTLVRAAPIYNVSSGQDFRNQLHATLQTAASSMAGYPVINPKYADWWQKGAQQALSGGTEQQIKQQYSPSTKQYRYSTDGGRTWQTGKAPTR